MVIRKEVTVCGSLRAYQEFPLAARLVESGRLDLSHLITASYPLEIEKLYGPETFRITQLACPMWVPLVENNELSGAGVEFFVQKYVRQLLEKDVAIDTVILGCTHYPLLKPLIARYLPRNVRLVCQGFFVFVRLADFLVWHVRLKVILGRGGEIAYFTTDLAGLFERMAGIFMEREVGAESMIL